MNALGTLSLWGLKVGISEIPAGVVDSCRSISLPPLSPVKIPSASTTIKHPNLFEITSISIMTELYVPPNVSQTVNMRKAVL